MPTTNDYLMYVLDLLRELDSISYKKMMGEYILYKNNTIFGGIYDNRFLVKKVASLEQYHFLEVTPYPRGKTMLLVDIEDPEEIKKLVNLIVDELDEYHSKYGC